MDQAKPEETTRAKHHLDPFEKISREKQARIFAAATGEFAESGFSSANVNTIAKKAQISIGSMYKYFRSKEDLFLAIVDNAYQLLEGIIFDIDLGDGDIFDKLERIVRAAVDFARDYPQLNQIYLCIASEQRAHLSANVSRKVETITADFYRRLIRSAQEEGLVDEEIDEGVAAFCIDNLVLLIQYSCVSPYFKERMRVFMGEDAQNHDERIARGLMRFLRGALAPRPNVEGMPPNQTA